jgi:hypothetical protein
MARAWWIFDIFPVSGGWAVLADDGARAAPITFVGGTRELAVGQLHSIVGTPWWRPTLERF